MTKNWERYEEVVQQILGHLRTELGFASVEGKGKQPGASGTEWEADAICYRQGDGKMILVECKHWSRRIDQRTMGQFAFSINDSGAAGGLLVTPIGYQEGAAKVANASKIGMATLNPDATDREYALRIAERLFIGIADRIHFTDVATAVVERGSNAGGKTGQ